MSSERVLLGEAFPLGFARSGTDFSLAATVTEIRKDSLEACE